MGGEPSWFRALDIRVTRWMASHGPVLLRLSLGLVFLWVGALKFLPAAVPPRTWPAEPSRHSVGDWCHRPFHCRCWQAGSA
jgi:hypothetical protein